MLPMRSDPLDRGLSPCPDRYQTADRGRYDPSPNLSI